MNPRVAQLPTEGDSSEGDTSINAQAQQLYDSFTPEQLALLLAVNGTARTAQVHHQDRVFSQQLTPQRNSPASSHSTPISDHVQQASRALTPSPQGRKRSRAPKAGSSTKKRKPSIDNASSELHSPPEEKAKRPLNSWIAFRCYYCKIFNNSQQKDISGFLRQLWQSDPFKAKWSLLASAWSFIRDEVGKKKAPLDVFIELVIPFLEICPSEHYLEVLGWEIAMDDGNGLANFRRSSAFNPDRLVDAINTPYSVIDVVKYAVAEGYVPEGAIGLYDTETTLGKDTHNFATEYQDAHVRPQCRFMDSSNITLAHETHGHLGSSHFPFPQQQATQSMEFESPPSVDSIEEYSNATDILGATGTLDARVTLDATDYSRNAKHTEGATRNSAPLKVVETDITTFSTARQQPRFTPFSPLGVNTALANTILPWLKGWMNDYAQGLSGPLTPNTVINKLGRFLTAENEVQPHSPFTETNAASTELDANIDESGTRFSSISTFDRPTPAITVSTPVSLNADPATTALSPPEQTASTITKQITGFSPPAGAICRPASALLSPINTSQAASFGQPWSPMALSGGLGALLRTPTFSPSMFSPASQYAIFGLGETGIFMFPESGALGGGFIEGEISERGGRVSTHGTEKDVRMYDLEHNHAKDKVLGEDSFSRLEGGDDFLGKDVEGK